MGSLSRDLTTAGDRPYPPLGPTDTALLKNRTAEFMKVVFRSGIMHHALSRGSSRNRKGKRLLRASIDRPHQCCR
ncbi:Uncharacterized protein TCM_015335 [Theobroma cacao]|uniref:Uncharacterized protein n=1 Tax=Theobroma cacao TaxID=3641 RepID=A0A061G2K2_THECC|nr:Uncharacterized protein TCM_015335 [Theobroma cacao]